MNTGLEVTKEERNRLNPYDTRRVFQLGDPTRTHKKVFLVYKTHS